MNSLSNLEDLSVVSLIKFSVSLLKLDKNLFHNFFKGVILPERAAENFLKKVAFTENHHYLPHFATFLKSISRIEINDVHNETGNREFDCKFLMEFTLTSVSCLSNSDFDIDELLSWFNNETRQKLKYFKANNVHFNTSKSLENLLEFNRIRFLDLSKTKLSSYHFRRICSELPDIIGLNVSETKIDNLKPLLMLSDQIELLDIHNLRDERAYNGLFKVISQMNKLRYLDISVVEGIHAEVGTDADVLSCRFVDSLRLFDASGHQHQIRCSTMISLLARMRNLRYFVFNHRKGMSQLLVDFNWSRFIEQNPKINFIGPFNVQTVLSSLQYAFKVRRYLTPTLYLLYELTKTSSHQYSVDLYDSVVKHFRLIQPQDNEALIAIAAVIYNLTQGRFVQRWPIGLLSDMVTVLISFLEQRLNNEQFVINCFFIICNDFIISKATFDKLKLTEAVLCEMERFDIDHINQTGVVILTTIGSELSSWQLEILLCNVDHFRLLLKLICRRCVLQSDLTNQLASGFLGQLKPFLRIEGEPVFDFTMKYALSAVWNLTDDCGPACQGFISEAGLDVYAIVIRRFRSASNVVVTNVYNKCLGLLNNISEDNRCRPAMLRNDYIDFLDEMLKSEDIQIKYFAGGILSNLLLLPETEWRRLVTNPKSEFDRKVYNSVETWVNPTYLIASYRSYKPFECLLLEASEQRSVILWALWAVRHTLITERVRYTSILVRHPRLVEVVKGLAETLRPNYNRIRGWARDIVAILHRQEQHQQVDDSETVPTDAVVDPATATEASSTEGGTGHVMILGEDYYDDDDSDFNHF